MTTSPVAAIRRRMPAFLWRGSCVLVLGSLLSCGEEPPGPVEVVLDPNGTTPLAAELRLDSAVDTRVKVRVSGEDSWSLEFDAPANLERVPLVGFAPNRRYDLEVTLTDMATGSEVVRRALTLDTPRLPKAFPEIAVLVDTDQGEPGHTLFNVGLSGDFLMIIDEDGQLVWYYEAKGEASDVRMLESGNLLFLHAGDIVEMDLLGNETRRVEVSSSDIAYHHEVYPLDDGTLFTLGHRIREVSNFRLDYENPRLRGSATVTDDLIIEIDPADEIVYKRPLVDVLDTGRLGYDSLSTHPILGTPNDWAHANAVIATDDDQALIVSSRHQDALFKVDRQSGQLEWVLANHHGWSPSFADVLLEPEEGDFRWPFHPHAPQLTPDGGLMLFDNGNYRATPGDGRPMLSPEQSSSRAVEYRIDESRKAIEQVWEYEHEPRLYSYAVGDADLQMDAQTVLITYGALTAVGDDTSEDMDRGTFQARVVEVSYDSQPRVVFEFEVFSSERDSAGWMVHRAERIPPIR